MAASSTCGHGGEERGQRGGQLEGFSNTQPLCGQISVVWNGRSLGAPPKRPAGDAISEVSDQMLPPAQAVLQLPVS